MTQSFLHTRCLWQMSQLIFAPTSFFQSQWRLTLMSRLMAKSVKLTMLTGLDTGISLFSEIFCCYPNYPSTSIQTFQFWTKHPGEETVDESHWLWNNLALSRSSLLRQGHASPQLHIVITDTEQAKNSLFQMQAFWRCCLAWRSTQKVWPTWHCWHWLGYVQSQKSNIWHKLCTSVRSVHWHYCLVWQHQLLVVQQSEHLLSEQCSVAQVSIFCTKSCQQCTPDNGKDWCTLCSQTCKACIAIHIVVRHAAANNALTSILIDCNPINLHWLQKLQCGVWSVLLKLDACNNNTRRISHKNCHLDFHCFPVIVVKLVLLSIFASEWMFACDVFHSNDCAAMCQHKCVCFW